MKDDLTKLCDKIENCNKCGCHSNEIVCAKYWICVYIDKDNTKFLKLKAEVNRHKNYIDDFVILTYLMTIVSILITFLGTIFSNERIYIFVVISILILAVMLVINIIVLNGESKWGYRKKWIYYIDAVLEDMERNPAEYNISD